MSIDKIPVIAFGGLLALSMTACGGTGASDGTAQPTDSSTSSKTKTTDSDSQKDSDKTTDKDSSEDSADDAKSQDDSKKDSSDDDTKKDSGTSGYSTKTGGVVMEPVSSKYASGLHHATIKVKDYGTIKVELDADTAPITVSNFAALVEDKFYDGLTFHRIMRGFMIQGGDPAGNGSGGAARNIKGEFANNGVDNDITHERGTISMARNGFDMDSASSQFFICDSDEDTFLDGDYAAFGHVTDGMDVVDRIAADAKPTDTNGSIAKKSQPVIESIVMDD